MKRETRMKVALLLLSMMVGFYFLANHDFRSATAMEDVLVSNEEYDALISERERYTEPFSFDLMLNEYALPYDEETNQFLYSLKENEQEELNPVIQTYSPDYNGYEIVFREAEFENKQSDAGTTMDILVYNDEFYTEYQIAFTTLPIVTIDLADSTEEGEYPIKMEDEWAQFELYDNREGVPEKERLIKSYTYVRLRGASSLTYPQKQMRLNLRDLSISGEESTNHLNLLDMRKDDDWILYAPYNDAEKMRNTFTTNLWYETSAEANPLKVVNGTEGRYVEVFIGDKYWGVYTLMFPMDEKQLDLDKNKESPLQSDFYYRMTTNELPSLEVFKQSGNSLVAGSPEMRFPDEPLNDYRQWLPLHHHLEMMHTSDPEQLQEYMNENVDLRNQIDYFLFYVLTQAGDNNTKNRNYIAYWQKENHFILESPWDLDLTWGNKWDVNQKLNVTEDRPSDENLILYPSLISRSLELGMEEIKEAVINRYTELRETTWSEDKLLNTLTQYEHDIFKSGAANRHHKRWPEAAHAEDASDLKKHVKERLIHMDRYVYEEIQGGALYVGDEKEVPQ